MKYVLSVILLLTAGCSTAPKTKYTTGDCVEQTTVFKFREHVATLETGEAIYRIEVIRNTEVKILCPDRERPIHEFRGRN
jgi:hypothetical protein